jgi:exonuclease SbcC
MLTSLILNNWKSHKHTEINFSKGYNVFVGNIGSGKTSIFDAIVYCLFGSTPNVNARKIAIKDLIMSKSCEQEEANLTLKFNIDDIEYKIERTLHKTKSSQAKIYKNDVLIRGPKPSDVNDEVEKLLNMNMDSFMKSNYAEQNSIDYFLRLAANERKALFDNLFDISFYGDMSVNARQVNNKLKIKYDDLVIKINEYKKLIENYNSNDITNKIDNINKEMQRIKEEIISQTNDLQKRKELELEINKQKINYENINNLINNLLGKEKYLASEITKLKDFITTNKDELQSKLKQTLELKDQKSKEKLVIEQEYNNIRSKTMFYNNKITDLNSKQTEYNRVETLLKEIPKDINDIVNKLVNDLEKTKETITQNETKAKTLESEIITLDKSHANCPICTQELTSDHKERILSEKTNEKNKLETEVKSLIEQHTKFKQEYELKNKQREFYNRNIEMFEKLKIELKQIDDFKIKVKENSELEIKQKDNLTKIQNEMLKIEQEQKDYDNKLKQINDFDNKNKDLIKVKEDIIQNKELLTKITYNPEEYSKIKSEMQKTLTELQYKKEIVLEKEKQLKDEQFKLEQYNNILRNQTIAEKESTILTKYIDDFTTVSNVSKKTQEQVRQYVVDSINLIFQDLWQQIYPYKDFTNIKFNASDGDYKIELLFNNEYKRELDEYISGGERSSIALALRIAMSLVMKNKLNLIVLDEPTHNLDNKTVLSLSNLLNSYLPQFVDQIFVITHDNTLEQYANNVYYIERNKETDGATEIRVK